MRRITMILRSSSRVTLYSRATAIGIYGNSQMERGILTVIQESFHAHATTVIERVGVFGQLTGARLIARFSSSIDCDGTGFCATATLQASSIQAAPLQYCMLHAACSCDIYDRMAASKMPPHAMHYYYSIAMIDI
jgi:hypothetical protein